MEIVKWSTVIFSSFADATNFYSTLANMTGGYHLNLSQFDTIVEFMMAICFREHDMDHLTAFEGELRAERGSDMNRSLQALFDKLVRRDTATGTVINNYICIFAICKIEN